jgi:hypothetical protein
MKDIGTGNMAKIEDRLSSKIDSIFPKDLHGSDGKSFNFRKGTKYLLDNQLVHYYSQYY